MRHFSLAAGLLAAAVLPFAPARVDAQATTEPIRQVTLYLWTAGAGGTIQPVAGGPVVTVDRSFSDLQEDLKAAFFVSGLVRSGRTVVLGDLSHFAMSRAGRVSVPGVGAVGAFGRFEQTSLTLEAGYQVVSTPSVSLDVLGGLRTWWLNANIVAVVPGGVERAPRRQFTDPLLAARGTARLADRWSALGYIDAGGFGVGSESTLQTVGTVNFEATRGFTVSAGYRRLAVDYRESGSRIDMTSGGLLFGATLRF